MQKTRRERKNTWTGFFIGIALVVVLILFIIFVLTPSNNPNKDKKESKDSTSTSIEVSDSGVIALPMEPYATEAFVYKFKDINWLFDKIDEEGVGVPVTQVNFEFEKFSRHEGSYVNFQRPYKTGTYRGECKEVRRLEFEEDAYGRPLAYTQCVWGEEITDVALFQKENMIYVMSRATNIDVEPGEFSEVYSIDMTTMVR